ncbi:hypothetical protein GN958_ATG09542 [Phytophthora infestans]|uniref:Uncharacterized protein n=1 Tax=Phytophthora infestans TaxID=4787 RepID=A0A8S9UP22_PHYIN|nr:hypothetical protein GN958_ATG09542 [Phytophthora infestans]
MTDLQDVKVNGEDLLPDSGRNWSPDVLLELVSYLVNRKYVYTGWKVGKPQHICSDFNMRSIFHKRLESVCTSDAESSLSLALGLH